MTTTQQSVEHYISWSGFRKENGQTIEKGLLRWMVMRVTLKRGEKNTLLALKMSISCVHKIALGSYVVL